MIFTIGLISSACLLIEIPSRSGISISEMIKSTGSFFIASIAEENQQIVSDVASYNLSPEQLAQFLQLANSGRLQEMLSGQVPMPGAVNADTSGKKQDEDNETDMDKEEEDFLDEENE